MKKPLLDGGEKIIRKQSVLSAFRRRKAGILEERSGSLLVFGFVDANEREVDCSYLNVSWFYLHVWGFYMNSWSGYMNVPPL